MRLAALAVALGGCSAIISKPPETTPLRALSECSSSVAPPVGDVILAAASGAVALGGLGLAAFDEVRASNETAPSWDPHPTADANAGTHLVVGLVAIPVALGLAWSARHGFRSAKACRNARAAFMSPGAQP